MCYHSKVVKTAGSATRYKMTVFCKDALFFPTEVEIFVTFTLLSCLRKKEQKNRLADAGKRCLTRQSNLPSRSWWSAFSGNISYNKNQAFQNHLLFENFEFQQVCMVPIWLSVGHTTLVEKCTCTPWPHPTPLEQQTLPNIQTTCSTLLNLIPFWV